MTVKEFDRLSRRDFENGATLDAIARSLRKAESQPALLEAAKEILDDLEAMYDGAPDSPHLWMGTHIRDLTNAIQKAEPVPVGEPHNQIASAAGEEAGP